MQRRFAKKTSTADLQCALRCASIGPMADDDEIQSSAPTTAGIAGVSAAGVAAGSEAPERKMLTLPRDLARRVETYKITRKIRSDAEALRQLIEKGLAVSESPSELMMRCSVYYNTVNASYGSIIKDILEGHPLLRELSISDRGLMAELRDEYRIVHSPGIGKWSVVSNGRELTSDSLDEEMPF